MALTALNVDSFIDLVQRSKLVPAERLEQILRELAEEKGDTSSPKKVAAALVARDELTRWQADHLLQGKHKGFFLGPYRFLKLLGRGGMGSVFLGQHEMMRRRCAIKVLPAKLISDDSSVLERFYLEAQAVASLDHPNIVRAYDVNKEVQGNREIHYLVMEYVEGQDLQTLVSERGEGLGYLETANFMQQAAQGLAHAHENGLIHRDIKPANLLVDKRGVIKILDLGLARFFNDQGLAGLTASYGEAMLGTADYLSPEQALDSSEVDTRTDIYSLGCTCYFLLTGQAPFPEGTVAQRLLSHQVKSPPPIEKFRPDVPAELVTIVERMIAKKPVERFQTAHEVADVFIAWLEQAAGEQWKEEHPETFGNGSGMRRSPVRQQPPPKSPQDGEELGLAPFDESPSPSSVSGMDTAAGKGSKTSGPRTDSQYRSTSDIQPHAGPAADDNLLGDFPDQSAAGSSEADLLSQPLDELEADPLADSGAVASNASAMQARNSGVYPARAAGQHADDYENRQTLWLILIGLGVSIPLALVILLVSSPFNSAPVADHPPPGESSGEASRTEQPAAPAEQRGREQRQPDASDEGGQRQQAEPRQSEKPQPEPSQSGPPQQREGSEPETAAATQSQSEQPPESPPEPPSPPKEEPQERPEEDLFADAPEDSDSAASEQPSEAPDEPQTDEPPSAAAGESTQSSEAKSAGEESEETQEELSDEDRQRLLARLDEASVWLASRRRASGPAESVLIRTAAKALSRAGIDPKIQSNKQLPATLTVELITTKDGPFTVVTMKAELTYSGEEQEVQLWSHEDKLFQFSPRSNEQQVLKLLRSNAEDFYHPLVQASRKAENAVKREN